MSILDRCSGICHHDDLARFGAASARGHDEHLKESAGDAAAGVPTAGSNLLDRFRRRRRIADLRACPGAARRSVAGEARVRSQRLGRRAVFRHDGGRGGVAMSAARRIAVAVVLVTGPAFGAPGFWKASSLRKPKKPAAK